MKTSLLLSHRPMEGRHLVRALLRIEGTIPTDSSRAPLNLGLVIDRSGSMSGEPLRATKNAARDLVRRLHPQDRVSVVAFDSAVEVMAEPGTAAEQDRLSDAIARISIGGTTNLSGGWLRGRSLVGSGTDTHDVNRLILLSDGHANVGVTDASALRELARQAAADGITTTTIGVGPGYDEELMIAMADAGLGTHYYMERTDQAAGIFEEELLGLLSISAQNIEVTLRPDGEVLSTTVLHGYPATSDEDRTLRLAVGDLYAREPREVLIEFVLDRVDAEGPTPVAALEVRADVLVEDGSMEHRTVSLPIEFTPADGPVTHPEVERVRLLLRSAQARDEAVRRADEGDLDGAIEALREIGDELYALAPDDETVREQADDLHDTALRLEEQQAYLSEDRKYMRSRSDMTKKSKMLAMAAARRERDERMRKRRSGRPDSLKD